MAGFGVKVKLNVDKSGAAQKEFKSQIIAIASKIKAVNVKAKLTINSADINALAKQIKTGAEAKLEISPIKIKKIDCSQAIKGLQKDLQNVINSLSIKNGVTISGLVDPSGIGEIKTKIEDTNNTVASGKKQVESYAAKMKVLSSTAKALDAQYKTIFATGKNGITDETALNNIISKYSEYSKMLSDVNDKIKAKQAVSEQEIDELQKQAVEIRNLIQAEKDLAQQRNSAKSGRRGSSGSNRDDVLLEAGTKEYNKALEQTVKLLERIQSAQRNWTKANRGSTAKDYKALFEYESDLNKLIENLKGGELTSKKFATSISALQARFAQTKSAISGAGRATKSFSDRLGGLAAKFGSWLSVSQIIMQAYRAVKQMVTVVVELDTAMTELRKVTNETEDVYNKFLDSATERAKALGTTIRDAVSASADFARLGYSLDESASLADAALVYKNVGDGIENISDSSSSIISTLKAFNVEAKDAMFVVDKFNEVGNNFAISSKGVGDALLRSASALAAGNNTLDESIALVTAANSTVQDADRVGTTMKTVSMFLRAAKTEAEAAGESTEGMADSVSSLRKEILALTGQRVDIQLDENTFKSTYQIVKELSEVWDDLSDISQANILEMIGGKRNSNVVMSLIENFSVAEEVLASAAGAAGSALAENEKHLESIQGKVSRFKATFEEFSITLIDSSFVKEVVDLGTGILNVLNWIAKLIDSLGGLNSVLITTIGLSSAINLKSIITTFKDLSSKILRFRDNTSAAFHLFSESVATAKSKGVSSLKSVAGGFNTLAGSVATAQIAISVFTIALTAAIAIYQKHKQTLKEQRDAAIDAADGLSKVKTSVEEYKSSILDLRIAIDAGNISEKEAYDKRQELISIQQSLVDMFGKEAEGIDLVTGSIEDQIDAIDRLSKAEWDAFYRENVDVIKRSKDLFTDFSLDQIDFWSSPINGSFTIEVPDAGDLLKAIENLNLDISPRDFYDRLEKELLDSNIGINIPVSGINGDFVSELNIDSIYDALEVYETLYDITKDLGEEYFGNEFLDYVGNALSGYSQQIKSIKTEIAESETIFNNYVEGLLYYEDEYSKFWSKVLTAQKEYNNALLNGDTTVADSAIKKMQSAEDEFLQSGWSDEAVNLYVSEFFDKWNASTKQRQFEIDIEAHLTNSDDIGAAIEDAIGAFKNNSDTIDIHSILNFGLDDSTNIRDFKSSIESELKKLEQGGSVNLLIRPQVDTYALKNIGWEIEEGFATVFSSTYSNESGTLAANFTPIFTNPETGEVSYLTEDELTAYAEGVIAGVREDDLKIQIGGFFNGDSAIEDAVNAGKKISELHELYFASEENLLDHLADEADDKARAYESLKSIAEDYELEIDDLCNVLVKLGYIQDTTGESTTVYEAKLSSLTDTLSKLQSSYSALASAEADMAAGMASGKGLTSETISALASADEGYLDYLYEENGAVKLNTEAWKDNANAKMLREMVEIESEIGSLAEQNRLILEQNDALRENIAYYEEQKAIAIDDGIWNQKIDEATSSIKENSETLSVNSDLIRENQGLLAVYGAIYGDITGDISAYNSALENFANVATVIDSVATSYAGLANLQKAVANGFTFSLDKILEYAKAYPEILSSATATANGELALNEAVVNSFIAGKKAELNAQIDAEIAKLEADKAVLTAKKENASAQLELAKAVTTGETKLTKEEAIYKLNTGNALAEALISMEIDKVTAYKLATAAMAENEKEFTRIAMECFKDMDEKSAKAAYNMARSIFENSKISASNIASIATQAHETAKAIRAMANGVIAGADYSVFHGGSGVYIGSYDYSSDSGNFVGSEYSYNAKQISLDEYISDLKLDISDYEDAIEQINGQIATLEALRNTPFESFKNLVDNTSSIVGEKTNDKIEQEQKEAAEAKKKLVEEYIAAIDEYYFALKRLEEVQKRRTSLEKKLEHTEDFSEKIFLSSGLISAYDEEIDAERGLIAAKQATITANVATLRGLGFDVSYDPSSDELYIKNLEHINDITASSVGKYESLQEATNALRKETEELIKTTEQLNDDNIKSSENIEDLGYKIQDTKNEIIDYVEEVYEKQSEAYRKIIDLRKELIESAKDELDYEDEIAEKVKEIAELQTRIDQLALDDSREAQAERAALEQELAEKQEDLADTQRDHSTEAQTEALDKMADDFEQERANEIEIMRATVSESEELWTVFYDTILGKTVTVGESVNEHVANAWINAANAVNDYSSAMSGISTGGVLVSQVPKYHTGGLVSESNVGDNETLALLEKGEIVLDDHKKNALYEIVDFQEELKKRFGKLATSFSLSNIIPQIKQFTPNAPESVINNMQNIVFEPHISVDISHNGDMTNEDAKNYGERIADVTIDKLYSAFERRGINSTRAARLKP